MEQRTDHRQKVRKLRKIMGEAIGSYRQLPCILRCAEPSHRVLCTDLAPAVSLLSGFFAVFFSFILVCLLHNKRGNSLRRTAMSDVLLLATTVIFFAIAWAYTRGCDHL